MMGWRAIAKLVFSLACLALAVWLMDWRRVVASIVAVSPLMFLSIVGLCVVGIAIMSLRWWYMIRPHLRIGLITSSAYYGYATFLNLLSPANLAGDAYRVLALGRLGAPRSEVIVEILRERVIGLLTYATGYLGFLAIEETRAQVPLIFIWIGGFAAAGSVALLAAPAFANLLLKHVSIIERYPRILLLIKRSIGVFTFRSPRDLLRLMLTSYAALLMWVATFWILSSILGLHVSVSRIAMAVVLTEIIRIVPFTIQGIGIREGAFTYFIGLFGGVTEVGFAVVGIAYIALACAQLLCGFSHVRIRPPSDRGHPRGGPDGLTSTEKTPRRVDDLGDVLIGHSGKHGQGQALVRPSVADRKLCLGIGEMREAWLPM